eukprot:455007_1
MSACCTLSSLSRSKLRSDPFLSRFGRNDLRARSTKGDLMDQHAQALAIINSDDTLTKEQKSNQLKLLNRLQEKIDAFDDDPSRYMPQRCVLMFTIPSIRHTLYDH